MSYHSGSGRTIGAGNRFVFAREGGMGKGQPQRGIKGCWDSGKVLYFGCDGIHMVIHLSRFMALCSTKSGFYCV